jgi:queuine/archaeosine tRNA-ribosyltransferase
LIDITLKKWRSEYSDVNLFVPLHGDTVDEYLAYLDRILDLDKKEKIKFQGFAIGGLGNPNLIDKDEWGIPDGVNGKVKGALYLNKICFAIRNRLNQISDQRPIHVLGAASPYNLIPLILSGVDTFDCHSAWRRASDGNSESKSIVLRSIKEKIKTVPDDASFSKILIPLLNNDGSIIPGNALSFLEFKEIHKVNQKDLNCSCPICQKFSLDTIKQLYSGDQEENYFAKILIYIHSIYQYQFISELFSKINNESEIEKVIQGIPKSKFRDNLIAFIKDCDQ